VNASTQRFFTRNENSSRSYFCDKYFRGIGEGLKANRRKMRAATNKNATSPHKKGIGLGPESTGAFQRMIPKYAAQLMNSSAKIPQIHCLTLSP